MEGPGLAGNRLPNLGVFLLYNYAQCFQSDKGHLCNAQKTIQFDIFSLLMQSQKLLLFMQDPICAGAAKGLE